MDDQPYDTKSDVWSLGCVVYELATFAPPFNGKAIGAVVYQILNAEPAPLSPCYSKGFQDMVKTLLTKDPRVSLELLLLYSMADLTPTCLLSLTIDSS